MRTEFIVIARTIIINSHTNTDKQEHRMDLQTHTAKTHTHTHAHTMFTGLVGGKQIFPLF